MRRPRAFVSVHLNASPPGGAGCEVWVHDRASGASLALAEALLDSLSPVTGAAAPGPLQGPMAVLDPSFHPPGTPACLVELCDLADAGQEARLRSASYLDAIALALAQGIEEGAPAAADEGPFSVRAVEEEFDVWHEVPLVQQLTGMSCWAAAAAMLVGWRECVDVNPEEVAHGAGHWEAYRDGLEPEDVETLADAWGLVIEPPRRYSVSSLRELLERNGPLWVGEASPGLHVIVIAGMAGDGTLSGTKVRIADPWPVGRGERYSVRFDELLRNLDLAAGISGVPAQVLHTGGRGRSRSVVKRRREVQVSFGASESSIDRLRSRLSSSPDFVGKGFSNPPAPPLLREDASLSSAPRTFRVHLPPGDAGGLRFSAAPQGAGCGGPVQLAVTCRAPGVEIDEPAQSCLFVPRPAADPVVFEWFDLPPDRDYEISARLAQNQVCAIPVSVTIAHR